MPGAPRYDGETCKEPDENEIIGCFPAGHFADWSAANGVVAVNSDGCQGHDVDSEAREHCEESRQAH